MTKPTWTSWKDASEEERIRALRDPAFWESLSASQQDAFLAEADWQVVRRVPAARQRSLDALVPLEKIAEQLGTSLTDVYRKMSEEGLPACLVDGQWMANPAAIDAWRATNRDKRT